MYLRSFPFLATSSPEWWHSSHTCGRRDHTWENVPIKCCQTKYIFIKKYDFWWYLCIFIASFQSWKRVSERGFVVFSIMHVRNKVFQRGVRVYIPVSVVCFGKAHLAVKIKGRYSWGEHQMAVSPVESHTFRVIHSAGSGLFSGTERLEWTFHCVPVPFVSSGGPVPSGFRMVSQWWSVHCEKRAQLDMWTGRGILAGVPTSKVRVRLNYVRWRGGEPRYFSKWTMLSIPRRLLALQWSTTIPGGVQGPVSI